MTGEQDRSGERDGAEPIALGMLENLVGYHLRRASGAFGADFARAVEGTGMRQVLVGILSIIAANPGVNQGAVGRALGIKRANMVALINELVDRDLVDRQVSPTDRRSFELNVTKAGQDMLDDCNRRVEQHEARMLAALSKTDRERLLDLLQKIEALG